MTHKNGDTCTSNQSDKSDGGDSGGIVVPTFTATGTLNPQVTHRLNVANYLLRCFTVHGLRCIMCSSASYWAKVHHTTRVSMFHRYWVILYTVLYSTIQYIPYYTMHFESTFIHTSSESDRYKRYICSVSAVE